MRPRFLLYCTQFVYRGSKGVPTMLIWEAGLVIGSEERRAQEAAIRRYCDDLKMDFIKSKALAI